MGRRSRDNSRFCEVDDRGDVLVDHHIGERRARRVVGDVELDEFRAACPEVALNSPGDPARRGSQVSFRHPQGYAVMQALIAAGVIGDFRAPDVLRFGFAPLYNDLDDVGRAVDTLARILRDGSWDNERFRQRAAVT